MYKIYVSEETYMRYIRRGVLYEIYGDEEGFGRGPAAGTAVGRPNPDEETYIEI